MPSLATFGATFGAAFRDIFWVKKFIELPPVQARPATLPGPRQ